MPVNEGLSIKGSNRWAKLSSPAPSALPPLPILLRVPQFLVEKDKEKSARPKPPMPRRKKSRTLVGFLVAAAILFGWWRWHNLRKAVENPLENAAVQESEELEKGLVPLPAVRPDSARPLPSANNFAADDGLSSAHPRSARMVPTIVPIETGGAP